MARDRIRPGFWGEFTFTDRTSTKTVQKNGKMVEVSDPKFTVRCHYRDDYGTYSQPQATASSKAKAKTALEVKLRAKPIVVATRITKDSPISMLVAERLQEIRNSSSLEDSTKNHYRKTLENVILPELGKLAIREATTARLNAKVQEWVTDGYLTQAYNARLQLSECFRLAVQIGILQVNPVREVRVVDRAEANPRAITKAELSALRRAAAEWDNAKRPGRKNLTSMSDLVAVFTMTGCRIGEALALRFEDVNWSTNEVTICGTVDELTGLRKPHTKSKAGMRTIDVPQKLMDVFRRRFENQPPFNPHGAVFVTNDGTWVLPCNVRTIWRRIRKTVGLEWVNPQSFRVTVGTDVGNMVSPNAAAQLLGHASDAVTRKHYMDKSTAPRPNVSEILEKLNEEPGA